MKEIKVTDDYLGLDENIRQCQNEEAFERCQTRQYLDAVEMQCKCIPYALKYILKYKSNLVGNEHVQYI